MEYGGDRITFQEARRRSRQRGRSNRICFARLNRYWIIDGWKGNGSQFINHSCDPNLYVSKLRGHILLFSLKRIGRGEELTTDYGLQSNAGRIPCRCGAPHCRGTINRK